MKHKIRILVLMMVLVMLAFPQTAEAAKRVDDYFTVSNDDKELCRDFTELWQGAGNIKVTFKERDIIDTYYCNIFEIQKDDAVLGLAAARPGCFPQFFDSTKEGDAFCEILFDENGVRIGKRVATPKYSNKKYAYDRPAYKKLSAAEKKIYNAMYKNAKAFKSFKYPASKYDQVVKAHVSIWADYPEMKNYFDLTEVNDSKTGALRYLKSHYTPGWDGAGKLNTTQIKAKMADYNKTCDTIVKNMPSGLNTYEKYLYLATVVSDIADYNYDHYSAELEQWCASCSQSYGAIETGLTTCQGYSEAFRELCRKAGLYCRIVIGKSKANDEGHAWNLVKLEKGTYHIDLTWCDESGVPGSQGWMKYFMLTQSEIKKDHKITDKTAATAVRSVKKTSDYQYWKELPQPGETVSVGQFTYQIKVSDIVMGEVAVINGRNNKPAKITIPDRVKINGVYFDVTAIGANAFKGYTKLKQVTIGSRVTKIGKGAFYGDKALKKVTIRSSMLTAVDKTAFLKCHKKMKIGVPKKKYSAYKKLLKGKALTKI